MTPEEIDHVQLTLGSLVVAFSELEEAVASGIAEFFPSDCFKEIELLTNALPSLKKGVRGTGCACTFKMHRAKRTGVTSQLSTLNVEN